MITTDKFVFVHMHKTGGQSLGHIIEDCVPSMRHIGYHYPYHLLPQEYAQLPVVGMVRNPWDWYISWFAFNTRPDIGNPLFYIVSDGCQADYRQTITNLANLCTDTEGARYHRKALLEILPDTLEGNTGVGLSKECIRNIEPSDIGYYSWQFRRMHGNIDRAEAHIGRFENLQDEFLGIMQRLDVAETDAIRARFERAPRLNSSSHSHYSLYYDDELRQLIATREKDLIERYGYQFESGDSDRPRIDFPSIQINHKHDGFRKLGGKARNFLLLKSDVDVEPLRRKLAKIPERAWFQSGRENRYEVHKQTQALQIIYDEDFRHYNPTYHDLYKEFRRELQPIMDDIADYFEHDGFIVRVIFTRLEAGGEISTHSDGLYSLLKCRRIHIPINTNDKVFFWVGGEEINMRAGEMWEINNATLHAVFNRSDEARIHLIIDWVPNSTVRLEDKRPPVKKSAAASPRKVQQGYNGRVVGRNEPCPCKSGKKFKRCHGAPR